MKSICKNRRMHIKSDADDDGEESGSDEGTEKNTVKAIGNNIYFYGGIDVKSVMEFNIMLMDKERELTKSGIEFGYTPEINVYIQSDGGEVYAGLSAMDHIKSCRVHVNTIADGCVASAATFMLLGGHERYIMAHASILIHQIRTGFWGRWEELKDEHKNCENIMKTLKRVYKDNSKLSDKKLTELLSREIFLTADECVKYGIALQY